MMASAMVMVVTAMAGKGLLWRPWRLTPRDPAQICSARPPSVQEGTTGAQARENISAAHQRHISDTSAAHQRLISGYVFTKILAGAARLASRSY